MPIILFFDKKTSQNCPLKMASNMIIFAFKKTTRNALFWEAITCISTIIYRAIHQEGYEFYWESGRKTWHLKMTNTGLVVWLILGGAVEQSRKIIGSDQGENRLEILYIRKDNEDKSYPYVVDLTALWPSKILTA